MERPDIPFADAEGDCWGTQVWIARVNALMSHIRIMRDHIDDSAPLADWLRNQAEAGLREGRSFIAEARPSDCPETTST